MRPLICPQCGGQIKHYLPGQTFATCGYCATRFLIEDEMRSAQAADLSPPAGRELSPAAIAGIVAALLLVIGAVVLVAMMVSVNSKKTVAPVAVKPAAATPSLRATPLPSRSPEDPNLLSFGGKGTGNGLFDGANSIDVDRSGRIYVSDDTLRVQQFDDKGQFLKVIRVPAKGANYDRARTINKIAVGSDGKLYVAVAGVVQVYNEDSTEPARTIQVAPDYIQDFALRSDGGVLLIVDNDQIETLIILNKAGKVLRRISGFHTDALEAAVSPQETAIEAIRVAVDGAGNIFSIYAFGDLGSYQISSNTEDFMIARFTPEVKYVNKFVQTMDSCGIEVDDQSRIYISNGRDTLQVYSNKGEAVNSISGLTSLNAFALDSKNDVYAVLDDVVVKRAGIKD